MALTLPAVWSLDGTTSTGRVEVDADGLTLRSRGRSFGIRGRSIEAFTIGRGPADRLRGLPVLLVRVRGGSEVAIASMGGAGSLQELAAAVGRQASGI